MITERVDRISPDDLTQLAFEVGPLPMHIGAVPVLDPVAPDDVAATLARRVTAVAGALGTLLARRGEEVDSLVVSVAVAGRIGSTPERLGNRVGVMPVTVPVRGDPWQRLERVAAMTRSRKVHLRGASASLSGPVFRALRAMGALGRLIGRQRLVNTFVTSVRGPDRRPTFAGAVVADLIPLNHVTVAFTALSYAGTLTVAVAADPVACPDPDVVAAELQRALEELCG